jgi:hypothetical protein
MNDSAGHHSIPRQIAVLIYIPFFLPCYLVSNIRGFNLCNHEKKAGFRIRNPHLLAAGW